MPDAGAHFNSVLEKRAQRYGAPIGEANSAAEVGTFVGCRVGDSIFGFPVALVAGFAPLGRFTPVAGLPFVRGLTHLRGDVMALVDVLEAVSGQPVPRGHWMLILQGRNGRAGVPIDEFLDARLVRQSDLLPSEQVPGLMRGISAATHDLWLLLDGTALRGLLEPTTSAPSSQI